VLLDPLQQVADLEVGVPVVGVLDLGALAEERVRFVEEQHHIGAVRSVEEAAQVLFGLANVLADDPGKVDFVQV
jgi:hypothetical protein